MLCAGLLLVAMPSTILADDLGANHTEAPPHDPPLGFSAATAITDVDNGDGTWTYTMWVDEASTSPHYNGPWNPSDWYGFEWYSWFDQDYGWLHEFSHWNDPNLNILSATLTIRAWDIDSEPFHGYGGEYDGVHVDGSLLSPGYLQGTNATWSVTEFDLPISTILDDGIVNVFLDIDMHHDWRRWATTLDYCFLRIHYTTIVNDPPYQPEVSWGYLADTDCITGAECITYGEGLLVEVVGPTPADPDGDAVTYEYRWFVDIGTGGFIDDEFAGRGDHTGNTVPPADIEPNDIWQVQIIPKDEHGAIGEQTTVTFPAFCTVDCPFGCIEGTVVADCPAPGTGLYGVVIDVNNSDGDLVASAVTDAGGYYSMCDIAVDDYTVTIVTPLGYMVSPEEVPTTVIGDDTVVVDYSLSCMAITPEQRTIGFWKHQVGVAISGKAHAHIDGPTLCNYLDLIANHFNSNAINQVIVYQPPVSILCDDKLLELRSLLNLKGSVAMIDRAKQQLMALLLNVASGKLSQTEVISVDGATVSQAITYCDNLIDDPAGDHEKAKTICDEINNSNMVAAGMIPLSVVQIAYKRTGLPTEFSLEQNYPNPFNPTTEIHFALPVASRVKIEIFNIVGQRIEVLVDGSMEAGYHSVPWDASSTASGVYLYRISTDEFVASKKMVLIK
jgi:hypothetical protein